MNLRSWRRSLFVLAAGLPIATQAPAQLPSASARALGMGDNYTAVARGYNAIAWNPALLAMDAPRHSITVLPVRGIAGLAPISLRDLSNWQGRTVPGNVRESWLRAIESNGGQDGGAGGDATYFAAQFGRFGVQASTSLRAVGDLTPGAAELLFFGNAGRTGSVRQLDVGGSELHAHAASTLALSYAVPVSKRVLRHTTLGVTAKYTLGHMLLQGDASGSAALSDAAINLSFPVAGTPEGRFSGRAGSGLGLDIGVAHKAGNITVGATIQNLVNTFRWDLARLEYRESLAEFDQDTYDANIFNLRSYESAPEQLKRSVRDARFAPVLATGVSLLPSERWTVATDVRVRMGRTTLAEPDAFHLGAGGEYRLHERVSLRSGAALIDSGFQVAGGVGVRAGPMSLGLSVMRRSTDRGSGTVMMLDLFSLISD